jgi:hypothetical protein
MQTKLIFSPEDSHANPIHQREKDWERKTNAICGPKCLEQYEKFPRVSLWAKMFAGYLVGMGEWYSTRCVLSWKILGIKSRPLLYLRPVSMRHTEGNEYGLLPTPRTADIEGGCVNNVQMENGNYFRTNKEGVRWGVKLRDVVESGMLPTPTAMDSSKDGDMTGSAKMLMGATHRSSGQPIQKTLTDAIQMEYLKSNPQLAQELANKPMLKRTNLPPQKEFVDWIRGITNAKELSQLINVKLSTVEHWFRKDSKGFSHPSIEEWQKIAEIFQVTEQMNARMMEQSSIEWMGMLPTPKATDERMHWKTENWKGDDLGSQVNDILGTRSHLNPQFVAEMMGFPPNWTELPFQSGDKNPSKHLAMP